MIWIIVNVVFLLFIGILMILNGGNPATFNFFGIINKDISTVGILIIGFLSGVIYSFMMYLVHYFKKMGINLFKRKKEKVKQMQSTVKEKEKEINEKEQNLKEEKKNLLKIEKKQALIEANKPTEEMTATPVRKKKNVKSKK